MVDPINTLVMMLPGTAITYNGEEIGMADGTIRWSQTVDPWGIAGGESKYEVNSRDPFRTPFHWNDLQNAGKNFKPLCVHAPWSIVSFSITLSRTKIIDVIFNDFNTCVGVIKRLCFKGFPRRNTHGFLSTAIIGISIWLSKRYVFEVIIRRTKN